MDSPLLVTLLFSGQHISILKTISSFKISQFSIHLLGDRFVIPGTNERALDKKMKTPFLNYTVKGLLFKTTIIPAVFFQMHCSQKMLEQVVEMEIKLTTLPCWF